MHPNTAAVSRAPVGSLSPFIYGQASVTQFTHRTPAPDDEQERSARLLLVDERGRLRLSLHGRLTFELDEWAAIWHQTHPVPNRARNARNLRLSRFAAVGV
jgi:hypothetical protein